jgi:predicted dehydrogenase
VAHSVAVGIETFDGLIGSCDRIGGRVRRRAPWHARTVIAIPDRSIRRLNGLFCGLRGSLNSSSGRYRDAPEENTDVILNLGLIGYGGMGDWHLYNSPEAEGLRVVAAYDIDENRLPVARKRAGEMGVADFRTYERLCDLLGDERLDAVLVVTPNDTHKELCLAAIAAGKNVVCEKPVMMDSAELEEVITAAEEAGVLFTVHHNRRWDEDFRIAREIVRAGTIGEVFLIDTKLHGARGLMHGWRGLPEKGGGIIYDWASHIGDQLLDLHPGPVARVYCQTRRVINEKVEDFFELVMTFEDGLVARVEAGTFCLPGVFRSWHVCGDGGALQVALNPAVGWEGAVHKVHEFDRTWDPTIINDYTGPTRTFAPLPSDLLPLPKVAHRWGEFYENVGAAIRGEAELIVTPDQVRRVMALIDSCFASAASGQAIQYANDRPLAPALLK